MLSINQTNFADYVGRTIRAQKASEVLEGVVRGRSNAVVADKNGKPVHPIEIETKTEIMAVVLDDGWTVTLN
ncbi:hypothetical protein [Bradyrhizobium erythrophlei]|uniref:hypothetical protein n=1 Tax=Bradyrhizobium erythrophlei TaxID=1437360 RepID=UPI0012AB783E|nr:hypothetical protein [Bradyrhizobium erythrophlei]